MARKGATSRVITATHATRARRSLRPRKRVSGAPDRSDLLVAWLETTASVIGVFMVALFKLRIRRSNARKKRTTLPVRCQPSLLSYHVPSQKYTLHYADLHHFIRSCVASAACPSPHLATLRAALRKIV